MNPSVKERFQRLSSACCDPRNHNKEELREQARAFVASQLSSGGAASNSTTRPDEIVAVLLQTLAPAFNSSHAARICALSALAGVLQACQENLGSSISGGLLSLLGTFLLTHAGPLEHDEGADDDDDEELVRDAAIIALTTLLRSKVNSSGSSVTDNMIQKISFAKRGVESRVALAQDDDDDHHMQDRKGSSTINGLSLLARVRRSLCFDLLLACVDGIANADPSTAVAPPTALSSSLLQQNLVQLVMFSCKCLLGESDPRCLIQLLRLLGAEMTTFAKFFLRTSTEDAPQFPLAEVFDAIAPYYPVQFSPPPNNPHGVTRSGLQEALRAIMTCTEYDAQATARGTDTMLSLSLSIILEQLVPLPGDEPTSMAEKCNALDDLSLLMFGSDAEPKSTLLLLEPPALRSAASALLSVHNEASLVVSSAPGSSASEPGISLAKETADKCRSIVARMAVESETSHTTWTVFVKETVHSLSETMLSSPSGRLSIAYMANLCGCGGLKTMELCLRRGMEPLLQTLEQVSDGQFTDNVLLAMHGLGAFFAACTATLDKSAEAGVVVNPHPLAKYSFTVAARLIQVITTAEPSDEDSLRLATAAVRAFDSLVLASPVASWTVEDCGLACQCLTRIASPLVRSSPAATMESAAHEHFQEACAKTIGSLLGRNGKTGGLLEVDSTINSYLRGDLLPMVVSSARKPEKGDGTRYDWMILASAASSNQHGVSDVLCQLTNALLECLRLNQMDEAVTCARALCVVFRTGGDTAIKPFYDLQRPSAIAGAIIEALTCKMHPPGESEDILSTGLSTLVLPPTEDEKERFTNHIEACFQLGHMLRPAWSGIAASEIDTLVSHTANAMPPLSDTDLISLAVLMPLLSAALSSTVGQISIFDETKLMRLLPDLTEFSLRPEHHPGTRSHAVTCIRLLVAHHLPNSDGCPAVSLANDFIMPVFQGAPRPSRSIAACDSTAAMAQDALSLLATICASAACRGGESARTADHFAAFFVDLASAGEARVSLGGEREISVNFQTFVDQPSDSFVGLSMDVAARFGTIFSSNDASTSQLWKQRLLHVCTSRIEMKWSGLAEDLPSPGALASICYMVCASNVATIGQATLQLAAKAIVYAFSPRGQSEQYAGRYPSTMKKLVFATLLKLLSISPALFSRAMPFLTTGVIRAYSEGSSAPSLADIACKILALQALESLCRVDDGAESTKPAVLATLTAAMNHPSSVIRNAAVDVRLCLN